MKLKQINEKLIYPYIWTQAQLILKAMEESGHPIWFYEGYRSFSEQHKLYQQGRSEPGSIVTWADQGLSRHNYGMALDGAFIPTVEIKDPWSRDHPWDFYGETASRYGFFWGGDFKKKDRPHIEMTFGLDLRELMSIYSNGTLGSVWEHFDNKMALACDQWDRALLTSVVG